jgi:hypothetical protein
MNFLILFYKLRKKTLWCIQHQGVFFNSLTQQWIPTDLK